MIFVSPACCLTAQLQLSDCLKRSPPEQFATGPWTSVSQGFDRQESYSVVLIGMHLLLYPPNNDSGLLL